MSGWLTRRILCDANITDGIQTNTNRAIEVVCDNLVEQRTVLLNSIVVHAVYLLYFKNEEEACYKVIKEDLCRKQK